MTALITKFQSATPKSIAQSDKKLKDVLKNLFKYFAKEKNEPFAISNAFDKPVA